MYCIIHSTTCVLPWFDNYTYVGQGFSVLLYGVLKWNQGQWKDYPLENWLPPNMAPANLSLLTPHKMMVEYFLNCWVCSTTLPIVPCWGGGEQTSTHCTWLGIHSGGMAWQGAYLILYLLYISFTRCWTWYPWMNINQVNICVTSIFRHGRMGPVIPWDFIEKR